MLKIAEEEGIQMSASAMEALIETTNNDIRSIINQLQMRRLTKQSFEYDDVKTSPRKTSTWVPSPPWTNSAPRTRTA